MGEGSRSVINECLLWPLLLGIAFLSLGDCCLPHSVGKSIPSQSMPGKGTMRKALQEYIHLEIGHLDRPIPIASHKLPGSRQHRGKDSASTASPGLSQPRELEEDIWARIEEATRERFHRLALPGDR
ncbi:hypothetical protein NC653_029159 [Populus alba x Populus x berolinensis]|uniref:Uncharacterized protein n=1 Tax=Populus alba x Populus x berolinensis TaxID=444605 RepID=A0AAD6M1D9_9ROSI|nr:hypothetical protein NC653_029159 [Populus alba x Populus x berolinensis]